MIIKQILNSIRQEFVYGGHFQGLVAFAIFLTIIILLKREVNWELPTIGYLLTFLNYRLNYYKGIEKDTLTNPERAKYLKSNIKYSQLLLLLYFIIILWVVFYYTEIKVAIIAIFLLIIGVCYTVWFKNWTKKIMGFKNFYISIPFGLFVIMTGFYYSVFNWGLLFIAIFIFLRMFSNTVFFDIKDIEADRRDDIKTIPVVFGKEKSLRLLHILNFFSFLPIILGVYFDLLSSLSLLLIFFYFYNFYYLEKAKGENTNIGNLLRIIADAEFLSWPVILIFGKIIT